MDREGKERVRDRERIIEGGGWREGGKEKLVIYYKTRTCAKKL